MRDTIIQEVTPDTLLEASMNHFRAYILYCGQAPGGESYDTPQLAWGFSGVPSPYMNSVVRTRLEPGSDVDACIESVLAVARRRSVPVGWSLMPGARPADMGSKLEEHGLVPGDIDPGLAVDLQTVPAQVPVPKDLRIVEVLDLSALKQWITAWGASYGADAATRQRRFEFRASQGLDARSPYRSFLAYLGDEPVATSELFLGAGVAAIMWVGTAPAARRQGIGAAITLAPLHEARRLGYRIGALMASTMGYPVYQALGFREMCRMPQYVWLPEKMRE